MADLKPPKNLVVNTECIELFDQYSNSINLINNPAEIQASTFTHSFGQTSAKNPQQCGCNYGL